jgi:heme-degrading monooxygenase HmoA
MKQIARVWFGETQSARSDEYLAYLKRTGVRDIRATEGNQGVLVLRRLEGETAEFCFISFWRDEEAIRRFAGEDIDRAVYYPEDREFLVKMEPRLRHFEIPVAEGFDVSTQTAPANH